MARFCGNFISFTALTMAVSLIPDRVRDIPCPLRKGKKERDAYGCGPAGKRPFHRYGLLKFVLILLLRRTFAPDATTCISLAAFCLALLVMPALVVTTRTSIESLPESLVVTGTALGFTEHQQADIF